MAYFLLDILRDWASSQGIRRKDSPIWNFTRSPEFRQSGFFSGASDTMATQTVMDHTGDTRHQFDPADPGAVAEAERRFRELTGSGFTAAKRLDNGKSEVVKSFDPTAEETLFIPRLQGG
jgi:hypothetical protein